MIIEFQHEVVCGVHRFYPRNRYGTLICELAGRKALRSPDIHNLYVLGIKFEAYAKDRKLEYAEIQKIIQSKFKEPGT